MVSPEDFAIQITANKIIPGTPSATDHDGSQQEDHANDQDSVRLNDWLGDRRNQQEAKQTWEKQVK